MFVRFIRRVVVMRVTGRMRTGRRMHRIGMRVPIIVRVFGCVLLLVRVVVSVVWHRRDPAHNQQYNTREYQELHFSPLLELG